ncbi:hypothetical protein FACS1894179_04440 [Bacteroidia bacterium]|nr:hypothetical protein FACS1894179_04440 [Bacteroidia bacterium]
MTILCAFSQVKYEISGGTNIHRGNGLEDKRLGFQGGVSLYVNINDSWYFRPNLSLINLKAKYDNLVMWSYGSYGNGKDKLEYTLNAKTNYLYLDMPLSIGYKILKKEFFDLNIEGGWFLSYGIGGKTKGAFDYPDKQSVSFNEKTFKNDKKLNSGPTVSISSIIKSHYLIRASGEWEITNNGYYRKYQIYSLSIGYIF